MLPPADSLLHSALEPPAGASRPIGEAALTDRQRLAVILQAAALLAHLQQAGWRLPRGWEEAAVDGEGLLRVPRAAPGRAPEMCQELLCSLVRRLFGVAGGIPGRGEGRRAARRLLAEWGPTLASKPPDQAVAEVLEAARFLWDLPFAPARRALAAEHRRSARSELWLAGPPRWRRRLLGLAGDRRELEELAAGEVGHELWEGLGRQAQGAAGPDSGSGAESPAARLAAAEALFARGGFEAALDRLDGVPLERSGRVRVWCHHLLGQPRTARRLLGCLEPLTLPPAEVVALAEAAIRVFTALASLEGARRWLARARKAAHRGGPGVRLQAEMLAAGAAWDRGDVAAMDGHLAAARGALEDPSLAWRWLHVAALRAQAAGDGAAAVEHLTRALWASRRDLARFEAAGLWNDLGLARTQEGDLAGAERAFLHCLRLHERCDGPRKLTLALRNLAEIRLRRGRLAGLEEILARSAAANREAGHHRGRVYDVALEARYELSRGRLEPALSLCRQALAEIDRRGLDGPRGELQVLAARSLAWLGRREAAATSLAGANPEAWASLEPEERPALAAHAGDRERALREVPAGAAGVLWRALLDGRPVPSSGWGALDRLEPFRAARLVFDCELLVPGAVPPERLRHAVATLRRVGAGPLAERLETREGGPWRALEVYLEGSEGEPAAGDLFLHAGYPQVRLWWESEERSVVVVGGPGGGEELAAPLEGGRLVLTAPCIDGVLRALFRLLRRDFTPGRVVQPPAVGGMVGQSQALRRALERLERFAAAELPVLILGESGTGKELAAEHLHRRSLRAGGPFVTVNCAALSETLALSELFGHARGSFTGAIRDHIGFFEQAQGGTIFLDEIGDLPATAQGMLLRVLQQGEVRRVGESLPRKVDVRVVAATHRELEEMVREKSFRQDLFYRLRGAAVTLPPLRGRGQDLLLLADHFLEQSALRRARDPRRPSSGRAEVPRLSAAARARLLAYHWPGNVRELQNVIAGAVALAAGGSIGPEHLEIEPAGEAPVGSYHAQVDGFRRRLVEETLAAAGGNQAEAARRLGVTRQHLSYLVRTLAIEVSGR